MLLIIVILLVAYIIIPLLDLILKENVLYFAKLLVLIATALYVLYAILGLGAGK